MVIIEKCFIIDRFCETPKCWLHHISGSKNMHYCNSQKMTTSQKHVDSCHARTLATLKRFEKALWSHLSHNTRRYDVCAGILDVYDVGCIHYAQIIKQCGPDRFKVSISRRVRNEARYPLLMTKSIEVYLKDRRRWKPWRRTPIYTHYESTEFTCIIKLALIWKCG